MRYAAQTSVPVERSKGEIERLLIRYGADHFASGWSGTKATIGFRAKNRLIRFDLPLPDPKDERFTRTAARHSLRDPEDARRAWEQACRAAWRALALIVKAKLEAVESGVTTFEQEFGMHIVLPGGRTVGDAILPEIAAAYEAKRAPRLLLGAGIEG